MANKRIRLLSRIKNISFFRPEQLKIQMDGKVLGK